MIGFLRGTLLDKQPPFVILDVNGVGYEVEAPMSTFFLLPAVGEEVRLLTHMVVREDAQLLYGFGTEAERRLFRNLLKVSGIGPKIALALLSGISVEGFTHCIQNRDVDALTRVPGIGRKTAERLLIEMKDRLNGMEVMAGAASLPPDKSNPEAEAFGALVALGYKPAEASRLLKAVAGGTQSTEEMIRRALQSAARD